MRAAQARQRAQADQHKRPLDLEVGKRVLLKISPMRGVLRLGRRSKLSPRFVGPFRVLEKVNPTAYRLELPPKLGRIHDVFHVSQLCPFEEPAEGQAQVPIVPIRNVTLAEDLTYEARPLRIIERKMLQLRSRLIPQVRIQWDNMTGP